MLTTLTALMLAAILITIITSMATFSITSVTAQLTAGNNNNNSSTTDVTSILNATTTTTTTTFQSNVDSIRVQVPNGWVVDDIDNTDSNIQQMEKSRGAVELAVLCPQGETLPKIGGGIECSNGAENDVMIGRFADLGSRPEFSALVRENKSITISDLLAYYIQFVEQFNFKNFRLLENTDRAVNVTDPQTNQTIAIAPAKYVETSYVSPLGAPLREIDLFVLGNDGNTGYILNAAVSTRTNLSPPPEELTPEQQQIFDSFELLPPPIITVTAAG